MFQQVNTARLERVLQFYPHEKIKNFAWSEVLPTDLLDLQTLSVGNYKMCIPVNLLVI